MRGIITKYYPAGLKRAPHIRAYDMCQNEVRLQMDDLTTDQMHRKAAEALCAKMGWNDVDLVQGSIDVGEVFVMVPKKKIIGTYCTIHDCYDECWKL